MADQYCNYASNPTETTYQVTTFPNQNYLNTSSGSNTAGSNGFSNYINANYSESSNNFSQNMNYPMYNNSSSNFSSSQQKLQENQMETSSSTELYEFLPEEIFQLDQPIIKTQQINVNNNVVADSLHLNYSVNNNSIGSLNENSIAVLPYNAAFSSSPHTVLDLDSSGTIETNNKYLGINYHQHNSSNNSISSHESCCDVNYNRYTKDCLNASIHSMARTDMCYQRNSEINNNHQTNVTMKNNLNISNDIVFSAKATDSTEIISNQRNQDLTINCNKNHNQIYGNVAEKLDRPDKSSSGPEVHKSSMKKCDIFEIYKKEEPADSNVIINYQGSTRLQNLHSYENFNVNMKSLPNNRNLHQQQSSILKDSPDFIHHMNFYDQTPFVNFPSKPTFMNDEYHKETYTSCMNDL